MPPSMKSTLFLLKFPEGWRWATRAEGALGSKGAEMVADSIDWREVLWINSYVRRWLWRSVYEKGSALIMRLVTKSLNSTWRPWNTYKLKSSSETDQLAAANSSNKALAFCINWVNESSPCQKSWKEPWSYIIRELDGKARACSSMRQTECIV